jgi:hypothetical protein
VLTAARSPWQNPYAGRLIGSICRECLDHVIILSERHLRRVLSSYFHYHHHNARTLFRSTGIANGLVPYSYPPQAITSLPSRRWAGYVIAMSAEPREIGRPRAGISDESSSSADKASNA